MRRTKSSCLIQNKRLETFECVYTGLFSVSLISCTRRQTGVHQNERVLWEIGAIHHPFLNWSNLDRNKLECYISQASSIHWLSPPRLGTVSTTVCGWGHTAPTSPQTASVSKIVHVCKTKKARLWVVPKNVRMQLLPRWLNLHWIWACVLFIAPKERIKWEKICSMH